MKLAVFFGERAPGNLRQYWETQTAWIPRQLAVDAADSLPLADRVGLLADIARYDQNARIRSHAIGKLLTLPVADYPDQLFRVVEDGLRDDESSVRSKAVAALTIIDPEAAVEIATERLIEDAENSVRVAAAEVLGKHAPIESLAVLARAFKSERVNDYVASVVSLK